MMKVFYIYEGKIIGEGTLTHIPQVGNYVEFQTIDTIFKITEIMFKTVLSGDVCVMIYVRHTFPEVEEKLRNYKR